MSKKSKINFRIDSDLKKQFRDYCDKNYTTPSHELTQFIYECAANFERQSKKP